MCTVVTSWQPGGALRVLAVRDEFTFRAFDDPGAWWPDSPHVVGGRDRVAGGSWCVSDVASGRTALVVNRVERLTGSPSRGLLPLAAVEHGDGWTDRIAHEDMATFTLVLAGPSGVTAWVWDAVELTRLALAPGTHIVTSRGVDAVEDQKYVRLAPRFATQPWLDVVTSAPPRDDRTELVVRHEFDGDTYATVFGQLIDAVPGELRVSYSRTPWVGGTWTDRTFT